MPPPFYPIHVSGSPLDMIPARLNHWDHPSTATALRVLQMQSKGTPQRVLRYIEHHLDQHPLIFFTKVSMHTKHIIKGRISCKNLIDENEDWTDNFEYLPSGNGYSFPSIRFFDYCRTSSLYRCTMYVVYILW